jgi:hypothetical protein
VAALLLLPFAALAQVSENHDASWWALTSGGGVTASPSYSIHGAAGQLATWTSQSTSASVSSGFITGDGLGTPFYSLTVTLEPQEARNSGAQWSIDGGSTWNNSGDTLLLPQASYLISAVTIIDWIAPAPLDLIMDASQTVTLTYLLDGGEGEWEGEVDDLPFIAQALLNAFSGLDGDSSGGLSLAEAQVDRPALSPAQFDTLDLDGNGTLERVELIIGSLASSFHSADQNTDNLISLSELLRVIQFFNSGGYACQPGTEDGYLPGPSGAKDCLRHAADSAFDWGINLSELLRVIQFFNSGGYHYCPADRTEDGFCTGLP